MRLRRERIEAQKHPSGAEAPGSFSVFAARLKPCPFKAGLDEAAHLQTMARARRYEEREWLLAEHTTESLTLPVLGMTCASCQHHVEEALRATAGVEEARVDLMAHRASVVFDPTVAVPQQLVDAIRGAGYDAVLPRAGEGRADDRVAGADLKAWVTLVAGAAAMVLAMPLGSGMGAADLFLVRICPWVYEVPADALRWFLLAMRGGCSVGGAGDLCERHERAAPRRERT